eukprot:scaffold3408_cov129-Amphora_coffeaeformis.AAC.18
MLQVKLVKLITASLLLLGTTAFAPSTFRTRQLTETRHPQSSSRLRIGQSKAINKHRHHDFPSSPTSSTTALAAFSPVMIADTICPKLGLFTALFLFLSPLQAVRETVEVGELCNLNPLPISFMAIVSSSWLVYGLMINDLYVALSNVPGAILSVSYAIFLLPVLGNSAWGDDSQKSKRELRRMQTVLLGGAGVSFTLWTWLRFFSNMTSTAAAAILGSWASIFTVVLFGSPLITLQKVLRTRNSASILFRLAWAQTTNAALWTAYGMVKNQPFVYAPNAIGLVLGLIQLAVRTIIPADPMCEVE